MLVLKKMKKKKYEPMGSSTVENDIDLQTRGLMLEPPWHLGNGCI